MPAMTMQQFDTEFREFSRRSQSRPRFSLRSEDTKPCLADRTSKTGFDRHYIYHTAWAARILAALKPANHVDIGSSLYFVGIVSAFLPITFYDYRPADLRLSGLATAGADLLNLPFADLSIPSLSCMHVVEHVGLGRYGDPLDPDGDLKAMMQLQRVVAPGGSLLFVVPIGKPRVVFNAHRVYAFHQVIEAMAGLSLAEFSLIPERGEDGGLIVGASEAQANREEYGCGCFWFRRRA